MIRKIVFGGLLLSGACINFTAAQCVPDTSLKTSGYKPTSLPNATVNVAYSQSISIRTPKDTSAVFMGNTVTAEVDSIKATSVNGLPPGFGYTCLHPRCVFIPDTVRCVVIAGTTSQAGTYPITIKVTYYALLAGSFKVAYPDSITKFTLIVDGTTGVLLDNSKPNIFSFPSPASERLYISGASAVQASDIRIFDMKGSLQPVQIRWENGVWAADMSAVSPGVYLIKTNFGTNRIQVSR